MFIRELKVDGYGALQGVAVAFGKPVTVVYGPNEAGKSTLIRFLRAMLYGFPTRKEPVERGEPVFGGRHGGGLTLLDKDGREWRVERFADAGGLGRRSAGGPSVREAGGPQRIMPQAEWERRVLGGISERLFRQLFSVSLDELHELLTLQGEEIGNYLYHSGLAGGASLGKVRRRLAADLDKLYRPRGSTQELNRLLSAIGELEAAMRKGRSDLEAYGETERELAAVRRLLAERENALPGLAAATAELRAAVALREWGHKLRLLEEEDRELSSGLPDPKAPLLPEEADVRWQALTGRRAEASDRLDQAVLAVRELRKAKEALRWDAALLERAPVLERLEAMRETAAARQEEKESVAAELRLLDDAIASLGARAAPDWGEDDLRAFVAVLAEREPLRRLQRSWEETKRGRERLEADAAGLRRQREALLAEADPAAEEQPSVSAEVGPRGVSEPIGPFRPGSRDALLQAWNALEDDFRRLERTIGVPPASSAFGTGGGRRSARSARLAAPEGAGSLAAAGIAAISALALALGQAFGRLSAEPLPIYAAAGVFALLAAWFGAAGWRKRRPPDGGAHEALRRSVGEKLRGLLEQPERIAPSLLAAGPAEAEAAWKRLRQAFNAELAARERQSRLTRLDREREALNAAIREEAARLEEQETEWSFWLRRYRLPPALKPDVLPELLALAEQGQSALRRRDLAKERLKKLEETLSAFRDAAAELFRECPPPPALETDPSLAVSWLYRRAAEQRSVQEEAERAAHRIREAEAAEREARQRLEETEEEIARAIVLAGEADDASYERRLRIDARRRELRREIREIRQRLETGRPPEAAEALRRLWDELDEGALAARLKRAEDKLESAERERAELLDKRGRLAQELERLGSEAEDEDRRLRLAEMESRLERLIGRYAVLAVADRLLQETKAVFEEERQPEVLRLASRYFSAMTGGAYTRILVPGDSPAVWAESGDKRLTDSVFLSRGTQEQLYLAMRFALAEAASREAPLPLLLDDLFVHFDEDRLRRTVPVLGEIARTRQVILFTCHRHVAEAVRQALPTADVLNWEGREAFRCAAPDPGSSETAIPG